MLNKVILIGKLKGDPKIIQCSNGREMACLTVTTTDSWKNKTGGISVWKEDHSIVVFLTSFVETLKDYADGRHSSSNVRLYVEGKICKNHYTNKEGQPVTGTRIVIDNFTHKILVMESNYTMHPDEIMLPGFDYAPPTEPSSDGLSLDEVFQVDELRDKLKATKKEDVESVINQIRERRTKQMNTDDLDAKVDWSQYGVKEKGEDE
ncbi:MAG: single-stranded DNA-binding protein [Desulfamplus sp.]